MNYNVLFIICSIFVVSLHLTTAKDSSNEIRFSNEQDLKDKLNNFKETKTSSINSEDLSIEELNRLKDEEKKLRNSANNIEDIFGKASKEYAKALHTLGGNLYKQKKYDQTLKIAHTLVTIHEKLYGVEDFQTAQALGNLGVVSFRINKMEECRLAMDRALRILIETKGEQSKEVYIIYYFILN